MDATLAEQWKDGRLLPGPAFTAFNKIANCQFLVAAKSWSVG